MSRSGKTKIIRKDYDKSIVPFTLIIVYRKKGDFKQMIAEAMSEYPELADLEWSRGSADPASFVCSTLSTGNIFLFLTKDFYQKLLVHESNHIVFRIFEQLGARVSSDTEEFFAYIDDFVYEEVYNICTTELGLPMGASAC